MIGTEKVLLIQHSLIKILSNLEMEVNEDKAVGKMHFSSCEETEFPPP